MAFIPYYIVILFVTIIIDYFAGIYISQSEGKRRKLLLFVSIISTCLVLFIFKYYNFFIHNINGLAQFIGWNYSVEILSIILPIGLSFHTFQSLSYVIEVYRGHQVPERNFGIYSLYVMYYPQLVAGPIERPQNLLHQFKRVNNFRFMSFKRGIRLMILGFFLKVVVADRLAIYVDSVYNNAEKHSGITFCLATVFFAFQIYCDFAGYSSIAIGASRVMGIELMTNFRRPYLSSSISEFWRRWHISLSTWFKDYVYISLGGNRVRLKIHKYFNLFITFLISGFWHGANWTFVVWGALNGVYLIIEDILNRALPKSIRFAAVVRTLVVFVLICISWIFFRAASIDQAIYVVKSISSMKGGIFVPADPEILFYCVFGIVAVLGNEVFYEKVYKNRNLKFNRSAFSNSIMVVAILLILLIGVFDGGQFIYFQF
jgi:alginate O-acetyltransferase complex protein AlgI